MDVSYEDAASWWQKAAERGNPDAQCNLGDCYFEGEGVPKDFQKGFILHFLLINKLLKIKITFFFE